jgi:hypothetical protein
MKRSEMRTRFPDAPDIPGLRCAPSGLWDFRFDFQTAKVVIARSKATKQSTIAVAVAVDCFAEPVIGRAFARPVGSQ